MNNLQNNISIENYHISSKFLSALQYRTTESVIRMDGERVLCPDAIQESMQK